MKDKTNFYKTSSRNIPIDLILPIDPKYVSSNRGVITSAEARKAQRQYVMTTATIAGIKEYMLRLFYKTVNNNRGTIYTKPTPELAFTNPLSKLQRELKQVVIKISGYVDYMLVTNVLVNFDGDPSFMKDPATNYAKRWRNIPRPEGFYREHKLQGSEATGAAPGNVLSYTNGEYAPTYETIYKYITLLIQTPLNEGLPDGVLDSRLVTRVSPRLEYARQIIASLINSLIAVNQPLLRFYQTEADIIQAQDNINKLLTISSRFSQLLEIDQTSNLVVDVLEPLKFGVLTGQYTDDQKDQLYKLLNLQPDLLSGHLTVIPDTELILNELINVYTISATNPAAAIELLDDYFNLANGHDGPLGLTGNIHAAGVAHLLKGIIDLNTQTQGFMNLNTIQRAISLLTQGVVFISKAGTDSTTTDFCIEGITNEVFYLNTILKPDRIGNVNSLLKQQGARNG